MGTNYYIALSGGKNDSKIYQRCCHIGTIQGENRKLDFISLSNYFRNKLIPRRDKSEDADDFLDCLDMLEPLFSGKDTIRNFSGLENLPLKQMLVDMFSLTNDGHFCISDHNEKWNFEDLLSEMQTPIIFGENEDAIYLDGLCCCKNTNFV